MQSRSSSRYFVLILRVVVSVVLIGGGCYLVGAEETLAQLKAVRWEVVALVTAVLASHVFAVAPRWAMILAALGHPMRISALIGSIFLGFLFNQLLPTAIGGDALRAWRARQLGAPLDLAIHSVVLDRASGIIVVLLGTVLVMPFTHLAAIPNPLWWTGAIGIAAGLIGCAAFWALGTVSALPYPVVGGLQRALAGFSSSLGVLLRYPGPAIGIAAFAAVGQSIVVGAIWLLANEVQALLPLADIALVTFGAILASAIPISVAGWGVREGALIFLFGAYGVPADKGFAISVLFGACMMLASLPGAFVLLSQRFNPISDARDR